MSVIDEIQPHFEKLIKRGGVMGMHAELVCHIMRGYMKAHEHEMTHDEALAMCREYYKLARDYELARAPREEDFINPCTDEALDVEQVMKDTRNGLRN